MNYKILRTHNHASTNAQIARNKARKQNGDSELYARLACVADVTRQEVEPRVHLDLVSPVHPHDGDDRHNHQHDNGDNQDGGPIATATCHAGKGIRCT